MKRDIHAHHTALMAVYPNYRDVPQAVVNLLSAYASAVGYIEGMTIGADWCRKEAEFWKQAYMERAAPKRRKRG